VAVFGEEKSQRACSLSQITSRLVREAIAISLSCSLTSRACEQQWCFIGITQVAYYINPALLASVPS